MPAIIQVRFKEVSGSSLSVLINYLYAPSKIIIERGTRLHSDLGNKLDSKMTVINIIQLLIKAFIFYK